MSQDGRRDQGTPQSSDSRPLESGMEEGCEKSLPNVDGTAIGSQSEIQVTITIFPSSIEGKVGKRESDAVCETYHPFQFNNQRKPIREDTYSRSCCKICKTGTAEYGEEKDVAGEAAGSYL